MHKGFIKLHRRIREHWLYQEKRQFSRFEAWVDLLMRANYEDKKVLLGNELLNVKKGQVITSIRNLCERWNWSNTKVTTFLNLLEQDGMATVKSDTKKTVVNICNYSVYHDNSNGKNDTKTSRERHEDDTKTHNEEVKRSIKNYKEDIYTIFEHWNSRKIIQHKKMNQQMKSHINARLKEYSIDELKKAIDNYNDILKDDKYYWTHKWTLQDFMRPNNANRFVDDANPHKNFKKNSHESSTRRVARF